MKLFRDLNPEEVKKFQQSARDNYKPFDPISGVYHPIYQAECTKINQEAELPFPEFIEP